jgi:hypothetical protein
VSSLAARVLDRELADAVTLSRSATPEPLPPVEVVRTRWEFPCGEHSGREVRRVGKLPRYRVDCRDLVSLEPLTNAAFWVHARIVASMTPTKTNGGKGK